MARAYDVALLDAITAKQYIEEVDGVEVLFKPIPDCDIKGAMDPRLYKNMKKMELAMRILPKKMTKMELNEKGLEKLRMMFNGVKSTPVITSGVTVSETTVEATDGYKIPIFSFMRDEPIENAPILYFIHGGGFFGGHTGVVREFLKLIVARTGIVAFSIDYRLAPENPYPVGHEDCYTGLQWIHENAAKYGASASDIFVAGDSAGGNLTLYCANRAIDEGVDLVKGQLILYPTVNMGGIIDGHADFSLDKYEVYPKQANVIHMSLTMMDGASDVLSGFLGTKDVLNKYLTPYIDVSPKLPPTFVTVGEHDFLKLETLAYARKLVLAGVETKTVVYKGLGHAYIDQTGKLPQAEDCAIEMGNFIMEHKG